ncbi:ChaN family lipoprotein [Stutzerimonas kirkiae]|uniref:ChaN family lipoprotein n=1 Tax=Stutzerimonas kirkiae TaxID=2211392 RepID=UPI001038431D|nr:ChaN family lipoprotein [Stutzerimonas kirkiae]TBV03737.1 iron(III) ABC transporter [Stutzerimonas kirkiae]
MRCGPLFLLLLLSACQANLPALPEWQSPLGREHADLGRIRDLRSGEWLAPAQLLERLAAAPRVLVGEQHDNPDHHALQVWLLQALATRREQGALLLEMLTPDQQGAVDAVKARLASGQAVTDLQGELAWARGWDWALYGPLVRHALRQPYPLLAANLEHGEMMRIYQEQPPLAGSASTAAPVRQALLRQVREAHCGLLPESRMPAMLAIQQQRDRRMAEALLAAPLPALLFAGAYHVRRDLGVPLHLRDLGGEAGTQVLILAEVGKRVTANQADFVWYSAALPAQDHCEKLRQEPAR